MYKFPFIFIENYDSFRFMDHVLTFSTFKHIEINNKFEHLCGGEGGDLEVFSGEGVPPKRTMNARGQKSINIEGTCFLNKSLYLISCSAFLCIGFVVLFHQGSHQHFPQWGGGFVPYIELFIRIYLYTGLQDGIKY